MIQNTKGDLFLSWVQSYSQSSATAKPKRDWLWERRYREKVKDNNGNETQEEHDVWRTNTDDSITLGIKRMTVRGDLLVIQIGYVNVNLENTISFRSM